MNSRITSIRTLSVLTLCVALGPDTSLAQRRSPALTTKPVAVGEGAALSPLAAVSETFRTGSRRQKVEAVSRLAAEGVPGVRQAAVLIGADADVASRSNAFRRLQVVTAEDLREALMVGDHEAAEQLLAALAAGGSPAALRNLAAFTALTGRPAPDGAGPAFLAWLHRARGEDEAARKAAQAASVHGLVDLLDFERRDWQLLAERTAARSAVADSDTERTRLLGLSAAAWRMLGEEAAFEKTVRSLVSHGTTVPSQASAVAAALILNDRHEIATGLLEQSGDLPTAFGLLVSERRVGDALQLLSLSEELNLRRRVDLGLQAAQAIAATQGLSSAEPVIDELLELVLESKQPTRELWRIIAKERSLGWSERAIEHSALALDLGESNTERSRVLSALFGASRDISETLWLSLSAREPGLTNEDRLRRIHDALVSLGAEPPRLSSDWLSSAKELGPALPEADQRSWYRGLVGIADLLGDEDLAHSALIHHAELGRSGEAWLTWADSQAQQENWAEAAKGYAEAATMNHRRDAALSLQAWALAKVPEQAKAAESLASLARLLPLAEGHRRNSIVQAFESRGAYEEAREARELLLATADPSGWVYSAHLRRLASKARCAEESVDVAHLAEMARVGAFLGLTSLRPETAACLSRNAHSAILDEAAGSGHVEPAVELSRNFLGPWLANVDAGADLVASLIAAGRAGEADWFRLRLSERLQDIVRESPDSGTAHNSLAWFGARTRANLDVARKAAERAVELSPDNASYVDTLAEVVFQQGDTSRAVALGKRAVALSDSSYHAAQLERFVKGDSAAALPVHPGA